MTIAHLALCALTATLPTAPTPDLPADPAQRAATKALRGNLQDWQRDAYTLLLAKHTTCRGYAYVTSYGPWEDPVMSGGPYAAQDLPGGRRRALDMTMCAADRGLAYGTVIWADGALRVVRDRGGWVTVARAQRRHPRNERNLDFYTREPDQHFSLSTPYAVIGTAGEVHRGAVVSK